MKVIVLVAVLFPAWAWARFQIADFVKTGSSPGQMVALGMDPALTPLAKKFADALKNPEVQREMQAKMKPGQMLPYDAKLGMSEAEYSKLVTGLKNMKVVATGQTVPLVIAKEASSLQIKTSACSLLKDGAKVDLETGSMNLPGHETIPPSYFKNQTAPMAPADGYQWSSGKTSISFVYRVATRSCILSCDVLDPSRRESVMVQYDCKPSSQKTGL